MKVNTNSKNKFKDWKPNVLSHKALINKFHSVLMMFAILLSGTLGAQVNPNGTKTSEEVGMQSNNTGRITSFTARSISGNTYLRWTVIDLKEDGIFILYYSCDEIYYSVVGSKTATGVPIKKDIVYYFNFKTSNSECNYYRIVYVNEQETKYLASDDIYMPNEIITANNK